MRATGAKSRRRICLLLVLTVLVGVASVHLLTRGGELSLIAPDRAAALLRQVEDHAALPVTQRGSVERDGPEGSMPEMAARRLVINADRATIISKVLRACRALGLSPADAERRAIEPDAVCDGGPGHAGQSVHLWLRCIAACDAYLQTQIV